MAITSGSKHPAKCNHPARNQKVNTWIPLNDNCYLLFLSLPFSWSIRNTVMPRERGRTLFPYRYTRIWIRAIFFVCRGGTRKGRDVSDREMRRWERNWRRDAKSLVIVRLEKQMANEINRLEFQTSLWTVAANDTLIVRLIASLATCLREGETNGAPARVHAHSQ